MTDFTYTEAKEIIKEIGRFKIMYYKSEYLKSEEPITYYGLTMIESEDGKEYAIGTESEADAAWEEALVSYWDDCVIPEVPDNLSYYMDYDKWEDDAKHDGRGHAISGYDGVEIDVADLVMFRIN